ncbi:type I methionyl aminopeptidase [Mycoplasmoides alvi]|uniref:type I methionyl aminopeptidase n=1 Tax=Mycoplasmoides alvi TaxID=78580 RepID=UPI00051CA6B1|nr:type I methionyl aminopeptidase [Mycoplasmoides alvi]
MIYIKNNDEINGIKKACAIFKKVRDICLNENFVNKDLKSIDEFTKTTIESFGAECVFHGYNGFPGYNCMSLNNVIIHGIGTHDQKFGPKDKLSLDLGVKYENYICDSAFTIFGPQVDQEYIKLSDVTLQSIYEAAKIIKPGTYIGDISHTIQTYIEKHGYHILENYGGHGCGLKIHEDPLILNYGQPKVGFKLKPGVVICIEPMVLSKNKDVHLGSDNWSVISNIPQMTCHWEHMVLVTENGCEILTQ